jgi:hypothetical protein
MGKKILKLILMWSIKNTTHLKLQLRGLRLLTTQVLLPVAIIFVNQRLILSEWSNKETLPKPSDRRSNFDKNQQNCCCNHFGGWADDTKKKYKEKLKAALDAEGITYTNRFYYLGYNPPLKF